MTRRLGVAGFLAATVLLLTTCVPPSPAPVIQTVEVPGPTQIVTATPTATPTPGPSRLVICQDAEPETLYLYGGSYAARHVLEAIYDGPIDQRSYDLQPIILDKLPSLTDGDAYFDTVTVQAGDRVMDVNGWPVELVEDVQVFASHTCMDADNPDCVVTFNGNDPIQMEQMVVSWQLLDNVTWSDGEPVTADDSVYSYELACDPDTPSSDPDIPYGRDLCARTESYVAAGEHTVVWTGIPGYVDDLFPLYFFRPLPRHLWQEELGYSAADLVTSPESTRQPLGWGPFVITEWVQGDHVTMERNPLYFRADEGLPHADQVVFRFAHDTNELIAMLLAGQCDIGLMQTGLTPDTVSELAVGGDLSTVTPLLIQAQEQGLVNLVISPSTIWETLALGINPSRLYNRPDYFEDPLVRQAIAHCIDRQDIVDEVTYGLGEVADSYVPPQHPLYAGEQLTRWEYDPITGRALLAEAGWEDQDNDAVLEAAGVTGVRYGTSFSVDLLVVQGDPQQDAIAHIIRSNLADCGIDVNLTYAPAQEFFADGPVGPLFGRQFDMAIFGWSADVEPPCDLYLSDSSPQDLNQANTSGFANEEYDTACHAALEAMPGAYEYENYHVEAQRIFSEQLPEIPLFWWVRVAVTRPGVTNLVLDPSEVSLLWDIEEIGLTP